MSPKEVSTAYLEVSGVACAPPNKDVVDELDDNDGIAAGVEEAVAPKPPNAL